MTQITTRPTSNMTKPAVLDFYRDITQSLANRAGLKAAVAAYDGKPESTDKMNMSVADLMDLARYLLAHMAEDADMDAAIDAYISNRSIAAVTTALAAPAETPLAGGGAGSGGGDGGDGGDVPAAHALEGGGTQQEAVELLNAIPFGVLLGGPLTAAIDAQTRSSMATLNFVMTALYGKNFVTGGLGDAAKHGLDGGENEILYVKFTYETDSGTSIIQVPLLTILPISYLQVDNLDVDFVAKISAITTSKNSSSNETKWNGNTSASTWWGRFNIDTGVTTDGITKSDTTSSTNANYEMNVRMRASQSDMPGGLARVLGMLEDGVRAKTVANNKIEIVDFVAEGYSMSTLGAGLQVLNVPSDKALALVADTFNAASVSKKECLVADRDGQIRFKFAPAGSSGSLSLETGKAYKLALMMSSEAKQASTTPQACELTNLIVKIKA